MKKRILSCLMALALCLTLLPATAQAAEGGHQDHCLCGKTHNSNITTHEEGNLTAFATKLYNTSGDSDWYTQGPKDFNGKPLNRESNQWVLTTGCYYLLDDSTNSGLTDYTIKIVGNVTICLNGKQIKKIGNTTGSVFEVPAGSKLTLTDCKGKGRIVCANSNDNGSGVYVNGGTLNLYSGQIADSKGQKGTDSNQYGGGVYVESGTFNMYGGVITGNSADCGGVYVKSGTFNMDGGTIESNTSGGGVYVEARGKFIMNNAASVTANTIGYGSTGGAGVYVNGGTFTMNGDASVTGNMAKSSTLKGGGVYVKSGTFTMNGNASVTDNEATYGNTLSGGGVYVEGGEFTMNGNAKVMRNAASGSKSIEGNGGGVYVNGGTFEMNGEETSVSGNTAATNGGGVYVLNGTFTMNGNASITGNTANQDGGGVNAAGGTFAMNGSSKVMNNTGNGVYVIGGKFTVSGAPTVTGNKRNNADSNVYLMGSAYITIGKDGLTGDEGSIGVTKLPNSGKEEIVIAEGVNEDCSSKFSSDDETREVKYENKQLVLKKKATQPSEHTHSYNENTWGKNATHHWHECTASDCTDKTGSIKDKAEHVYENNTDTTCNVCGYVRTVTTDPILVTKITLSPASPKLKVGQTQAMTVVIEPQTATKKDVTWKSSKPEVATVANDGTVTAHKAGTAEITATAEDDSKVSATCKVTVTDDTTTGGGTTPSQPGGSTGGNTGGSSSGGGSSSDRDDYDSNPVIKTETKNNPDGSTTKTETRRDGSVTQTTTGKDGSVSKTETKPDGSSVTENKAADGSTGTVKTDKNGQTEAKTALSNKAVEDAKRNGEAVKAPVEVEATRNSSTAPTVKVELPKGAGETKVEIPVSNVRPGTVAVLVHPDGTEEILKNSIPTEDGIQLTVNGNATVKIVDNSKGFIDTQDHWAKDAIDFVSARELVNGMSATIYAPNNSTTRAQLWTILARQNDADLTGGANWYEKAQLWSKDKGISDGTEPNAAINRAQMVTMLWRAEGQPTAGGTAKFTDVPADSYYAQAVAWAVENGITTGIGGGRFDPTATCTRAQIAAFLVRSMK